MGFNVMRRKMNEREDDESTGNGINGPASNGFWQTKSGLRVWKGVWKKKFLDIFQVNWLSLKNALRNA